MITKEDFVAWKLNPVTVGVFDVIRSKVDSLLVELGESAGLDHSYDNFRRGAYQAFKDVLSVEFEEVDTTDA